MTTLIANELRSAPRTANEVPLGSLVMGWRMRRFRYEFDVCPLCRQDDVTTRRDRVVGVYLETDRLARPVECVFCGETILARYGH